MSQKPSAIIFGGLNTCSRALAALLVPLEGERLVSHLRIVDRFSVYPPTTYLGAEFPKVLAQPDVEYRQANLTVPSAVASAFDPPSGKAPYSYVFDLTGEINHDRSEVIAIKLTFTVARIIGLEAARRKVNAYVRLQQPVYETSDKGPHDEKEDVKPVRPLDVWWHETLRMLASIDDLPLVVLRIGFVYGPYVEFGLYPLVITVASIYGYMNKPMKTPWGPGKDGVNTVHIDDVSGGLWACAEWMASLGRQQANLTAGEKINFHNDKSKVKDIEGTCKPDVQPVAPVFNLFFGTTFEFYSFFENALAKLKLDDVVEEINEHHVGTWTEMLQTSNPPIVQTPLDAYMDHWALSRRKLSYNNNKIKKVIGYKLIRPQFTHEALREVVDKWKAEGSWPALEGRQTSS
ncbi:hypothetical protein EDD22DRAFT_905033 [Suillus occidentalis]|nr:hypothetical protein EDD22DRAFT_905033 [Suillus occidentalis]